MANTTYSPLKSISKAVSPSRYRRMNSSRSTPELRSAFRWLFGKSSLAASEQSPDAAEGGPPPETQAGFMFLYLVNQGDLDGVTESLNSGVDIHFRDIDERTALHIACCKGQTEIVQLLIDRGAEIDAKDRWGGTALVDAIHYEHEDVVKLLEKHGAKLPTPPTHVKLEGEVPEYEIDPKEIDLTGSFHITKGTFRVAMWRGTQVAVKTLPDHVIMDDDRIVAFRDELALLERLRHPNVVQFIGAVTQSAPLTIIMEYYPKGDLREFLDRKGALKTSLAVKYALDIARGLNYLHQHRPEPIIHRDLEPSNILMTKSGHLKVGDFGLSKLQKAAKTHKEDRSMAFQEFSWRYVAPEAFKDEEYDTKVDVFSFALIVQEMIEGIPPFPTMLDKDVPKAYCDGQRPPFLALEKKYPYELRTLIEQCWDEEPSKRPPFIDIVQNLEEMVARLERRKRYKLNFALCGCFSREKSKGANNPNASPSHASVSMIN